MAFTRKYLAALGIEAEKIDEIISAHVEVVEGLKKERDDLTARLGEVEAQNEEIKNNGNEQYTKLKKEFDDYKTDVANKETRANKTQAYVDLLKSAGVSEKRIAAIVKVSDIDGLELDENGKIKDEKAQSDKIKNDWAEFIETKQVQGAVTPTPPQSNGGGSTMTKEQIMQIKDTEARQKAIQQNLELFMKGRRF